VLVLPRNRRRHESPRAAVADRPEARITLFPICLRLRDVGLAEADEVPPYQRRLFVRLATQEQDPCACRQDQVQFAPTFAEVGELVGGDGLAVDRQVARERQQAVLETGIELER